MGKGVGKFLMTKSQQVQCTSIYIGIYSNVSLHLGIKDFFYCSFNVST